ncbi:MAG TPA: circadian clock KaiB family protein [Pyrinomonadaceae bacterium]|nr:circadian clock KaiB family protein [Pyrinomonadaceae bacterium]
MADTGIRKSNGIGNGKLKNKPRNATENFEEALNVGRGRRAEYILRLYVTGSTPRSLRAISNLKRLCDEYLPGAYDLQVIDIYKNPDAARDAQIIAAPTLIKRLPAPLRRFVGDLSNTQKLLIGLDIRR